MQQEVFLVHGGGEGSYVEDQHLQTFLSQHFAVEYPRFSGLESLDFARWAEAGDTFLQKLSPASTIVAHSLGGPALLKVLA